MCLLCLPQFVGVPPIGAMEAHMVVLKHLYVNEKGEWVPMQQQRYMGTHAKCVRER